jgi:hypothetical protein
MWKEAVVTNVTHLPAIIMEGLRRDKQNLGEDSWCVWAAFYMPSESNTERVLAVWAGREPATGQTDSRTRGEISRTVHRGGEGG